MRRQFRSLTKSFAVLVLFWSIGTLFSHFYVQITHKPLPVPHSVPLLKKAFQTNPLIAWLAVPAVIPVIEESFFAVYFTEPWKSGGY
jgi:membrane protease YdiL (CAAX protease family)